MSLKIKKIGLTLLFISVYYGKNVFQNIKILSMYYMFE